VISSKGLALQVRRYRDEDEQDVVGLLAASLGGGPAGRRTIEFFRWKHLQNPFGRSLILVGETDGRIVGLRAFLRWRFQAADRIVEAVRAVDTATHPDYQGRGVFSRLTHEAIELVCEQADLVFNTPNEKSLPGYLKLGWEMVGRVPVAIRIQRPARMVWNLRSSSPRHPRPSVDALPAAEALDDLHGVGELLRDGDPAEGRLSTLRTIEYLRWRYGTASLLDYRAVRLAGGNGLAIFRVRPRGGLWEATVAELLTPGHDVSVGRKLLQRIARSASVDHLTCSFPPRSAALRAAHRAGYMRAPRGMTLVANPLRRGLTPDPSLLRSWALALGDLEVF
jgi:GNAT superfamily N-acetyltransferase